MLQRTDKDCTVLLQRYGSLRQERWQSIFQLAIPLNAAVNW